MIIVRTYITAMALIIKSFLLSVMITEGIKCSFSDFRTGKISNRDILIGLFCSLLGNAVYLIVSERDLLAVYLLHILSAGLLGWYMYVLHIWAGGDVKLFFLLTTLIPAEYMAHKPPVLTIIILGIIFSSAFIFIVLETVVLSIRRKQPVLGRKFKVSFKHLWCCIVSITTFQTLLRWLFSEWYAIDSMVVAFAGILFVLSFDRLNFLKHPCSLMVCSGVTAVQAGLSLFGGDQIWDVRGLMIAAAVFLLRSFAERYNYDVIPATDAKSGMILSYGTILRFMNSNVKGLPQSTTEDMASRITQEQADSIVRWGASPRRQESITVLRKIPFATFITFGVLIYVVLGLLIW